MMMRTCLSSLVVLIAMLAAPQDARALDVWVVRVGVTVLGQIGNTQYMVTEPWDGSPCYFQSLGGSTGLTEALTVRGTNETDFISFANPNLQFCNNTMYPLVQNGYAVTIYGGPGDDRLYGGPNRNTNMSGGDGHDYMVMSIKSIGVGGRGNDKIYGKTDLQTQIYGDAGDDALCLWFESDVCGIMDGGSGTDKHCGSAQTLRAMEGLDCGACWL